MNILILNWKDITHPQKGGAEIIAHFFAERLAKDGHRVTFFCQQYPNCKAKETIDGVHIVRSGNKLTMFFHAFRHYISLKTKPDIVLEMINTIGWQTPLYVPKQKRVAYLNQLAKEVWRYEFPFPVAVIGYVFEYLQYITYKTTRFLCYSNSTKVDLISYGIPRNNIQVFPLGLDHAKYYPKGKKSVRPLFVFVARLVKMKQANLCIKAIHKLYRKYPDLKLVISGNGPEESSLKSLVTKLHLDQNVDFLSKNNFHIRSNVDDPKVDYMRKAWALLLPSIKEGWGMVVTEAAACGTPAIVSNVTGLTDSVKHNESGIIIKKCTVEQIAASIKKLLDDKKLRNNLSKGAIRWAEQYNWDSSYSTFSKLLLSK